MIEVSIIIVSYNNLNILANCIESIIKHTIDISYKIIIVDNNTTSGSIEEFIGKYSSITLIKNEKNLGFAAANNQALSIVNSPYVLFLNNDTIFLENTLKKIFEFVKTEDYDIIVGCELLNADYSHQNSIVDFYTPANLFGETFFLYKIFPKYSLFNKYNKNFKVLDKATRVDFIAGAFLFSSTRLMRELNGFDERFYFYGEEADLCYRAKKKGTKVVYYPQTKVIHILGATAKKNLWFKFKNQSIAKIQFFQKHFHEIKFIFCVFIFYIGIILRIPIYLLGGILTFNKELALKSTYYLKSLFIYPRNKFKNTLQ